MLAYLLFHDAVRREELVALLWGDVAENKARNAFRQTLHRLRSALGEDILSSEQDQIALSDESHVWCDATAFRKALDRGEVEDAIALYGGEFLEGLEISERQFTEWVDEQRRRFSAAYEGALSVSAERALASGDWQLAVGRARALVRHEPLSSDAAVLEASALMAGGRRAEAITALTVHRDRVENDLGAKPSPAVMSMLKGLLSAGPGRGSHGSEPSLGLRTGESSNPEFVGRESETAQLLGAWRRAVGGKGTAVLLYGEQGIGKTRLVDEFLERSVATDSALILRGQERAVAAAIPYASVAEALRAALNAPGIAGASQHLLAEAARLLPELRDQFQLPEPGALTDEAERVRFFEGIAALVDAIAYEQTVCIVLEDLHNASASTIDLIRYLAHRLRAVPVLIVGTWAGGADGRTPDSRGHGRGVKSRARIAGFDELELKPFPLGDSDLLLAAILRFEDVGDSDRSRLAHLAGGVPFRLIELADRAKAGEIPSTSPVTIRDVLRRRLLQCSPHEQRLFVAASLFTQAVPIRLLAGAAHISEAAALEGASSLEGRGLLVQHGGKMTPSSETAAELALESTGEAGVMLLANWAADALAGEAQPAHSELARLYGMAGRKPLAYRHARQAAWDALLSGAYDDAKHLLALAEASATTDTERGELHTVARTLGVSAPLLLPGSRPESTAETGEQPLRVGEQEATDDTRPSDGTASRPKRQVLWQAWGIRWWIPIAGAVAVAASFGLRASLQERSATRGNVLSDTLVLAERLGPREVRYYTAAGLISAEARRARGLPLSEGAPGWIDSLSLPWINPRLSPTGELVAVERVTGSGVHLYVIVANTREAIPVATGAGDYIASDWSPDGARLLVVYGGPDREGAYDTDLYAYQVVPGIERVAIDTAAGRSVVDARWSPRGTHIAWIAREGVARQQEIFVALADGSQARNLSQHMSEDYDLAWSADGDHIAFTTERDGNAEIYSVDIATGQLRRMTFDPAQDSRPAYSPDGQFVAFESARQGRLRAYVMTALAGVPRPIEAAGRSLEVAGWLGQAPPFLDELAVRGTSILSPGDTAVVFAETTDQYGRGMIVTGVGWTSLDPSVAAVRSVSPGSGERAVVTGQRPGLARIVATVAEWRSDTALIQVGSGGQTPIRDDFEATRLSAQWIALGSPRPSVAPDVGRGRSRGLVPNHDSRLESGILSTSLVSVRQGLMFQSWAAAPFAAAGAMPASMNMSLVVADPRYLAGTVPPRFLKLASITWLGEARRIEYAVGRESQTEPVAALGSTTEHVFQMLVEPSRRVAFYIDGKLRWRSTVPLGPSAEEQRVQLWLGARAAGSSVVFDDVMLSHGAALPATAPPR
ncbi:MAG: ATP-binding protein [Gemmatimonadaceae bacterium]